MEEIFSDLNKGVLGILLFSACIVQSYADVLDWDEQADSLRTTDIEEVVVAATPKENHRLRNQALASSSFNKE